MAARAPNGSAERRRLLELSADLDDAVRDSAKRQETTAAEWIRQAIRERLKREARRVREGGEA